MTEEKLSQLDQTVNQAPADPSVEGNGNVKGWGVLVGTAFAAFGLAAVAVLTKPNTAAPVIKKVAGSVISAALKMR